MSVVKLTLCLICLVASVASEPEGGTKCADWALRRISGNDDCVDSEESTGDESQVGQGPVGPMGPPGPPGKCDCDFEDARMLQERTNELEKKVSAASARINELSENLKRESARMDVNLQAIEKNRIVMLDKMYQTRGWTRASNNFYYKVFNDSSSYFQARKNCESVGARLASTGLRDVSVRGFVHRNLAREMKNDVWVGLDDMESEGEFVWSDGVKSNNLNTNWRLHQPNNNMGKEDCAHFDSLFRDTMSDRNCNDKIPYLCEAAIE